MYPSSCFTYCTDLAKVTTQAHAYIKLTRFYRCPSVLVFCVLFWIPINFWQLTEDSLKMVRDQVLVVVDKGESETDKGIVIAASVSWFNRACYIVSRRCMLWSCPMPLQCTIAHNLLEMYVLDLSEKVVSRRFGSTRIIQPHRQLHVHIAV